MALAAAEAAVGLAIVVSVYRTRRQIDLDGINELRN
jgi:NADH:ubiquinone oxidoreductase subunit K